MIDQGIIQFRAIGIDWLQNVQISTSPQRLVTNHDTTTINLDCMYQTAPGMFMNRNTVHRISWLSNAWNYELSRSKYRQFQ